MDIKFRCMPIFKMPPEGKKTYDVELIGALEDQTFAELKKKICIRPYWFEPMWYCLHQMAETPMKIRQDNECLGLGQNPEDLEDQHGHQLPGNCTVDSIGGAPV